MSAPARVREVTRPHGSARPRLRGWSIVLAAGACFAIVLVVANVVVLAERAKTTPRCPSGSICLPPANVAGRVGKRWTSRTLHYSFEYPSALDEVVSETPTEVHLTLPIENLRTYYDSSEAKDFHPDIWISGYPSSEMTAEQAFRTRLHDLEQAHADLAPDDDSWAALPAPSIGFQDAVGGAYSGTLGTPVRVAIAAASAGPVTVVMSVEVSGEGLDSWYARNRWGAAGDLITDTFRFS